MNTPTINQYTIVMSVVGAVGAKSPFKTETTHPWTLAFTDEARKSDLYGFPIEGKKPKSIEVNVQHFPVSGDEETITSVAVNNLLTVIAGTISSDTGEDYDEVVARLRTRLKSIVPL